MTKKRTDNKTRRQFLSDSMTVAAVTAPIVNAMLTKPAHAIALPNPGSGGSGSGGTGGGGSGGGGSGGGGCSGNGGTGTEKPRKK